MSSLPGILKLLPLLVSSTLLIVFVLTVVIIGVRMACAKKD